MQKDDVCRSMWESSGYLIAYSYDLAFGDIIRLLIEYLYLALLANGARHFHRRPGRLIAVGVVCNDTPCRLRGLGLGAGRLVHYRCRSLVRIGREYRDEGFGLLTIYR